MKKLYVLLANFRGEKEYFLKIFFFFLFLLVVFFVHNNTFASGITYTKVGEKFIAEIENFPSKSKIEWVLTSKGVIVKTTHSRKFSYVFQTTGDFSLRATVEDRNKIRETSVMKIFSVERFPNFEKLQSKIKTLPESKNGKIFVNDDEITVLFSFVDSTGQIVKYEFDADIFSDGDGDGEINNDIDNKKDSSYLTGGTFSYTYKKSEFPARARLKVFDVDGNMSETFVSIIFVDKDVKNAQYGEQNEDIPLVSNPSEEEKEKFVKQENEKKGGLNKIYKNSLVSPSGRIYLRPDLFASRSEIVEGQTVTFEVFSAPENAKYSWDFDGDGIFEIERGEDKKVEYKFSESGEFDVEVHIFEIGKDPIIEKEKVVVEENFKKEIETKPPIAHFVPEISGNAVEFSSSKSSADENLLNTDISYSWDFGDGFKTEGANPTHIYEKVGKYRVTLVVEDVLSRKGTFTQDIDITEITHEFSADQHGGVQKEEKENIVIQPNNAIQIKDKDLKEETNESESKNPFEDSNEEEKNVKIDFSNFSLSWWMILLFVVFIFIPLLLLIPLLKKKIENPDKDFSEIFSEMFGGKKIKNMEKEGEEKENISVENVGDSLTNTAVVVNDDGENEDINNESEIEESNPFSGDALNEDISSDTPEWMKNYDEEVGKNEEFSEEFSDKNNKNDNQIDSRDNIQDNVLESSNTYFQTNTDEKDELNLEEQEENISQVPDWLKGADSPFNDELPDESENNIVNTDSVDDSNKSFVSQNDINEEISEVPVSSESDVEENPFSDFDHPDWLNEIKDGGNIQGDSENDEEELPDWLKIDEDEVVETQGDKGSEDKNEDGVENFLENIEKEEEKENIGDGFKELMPNDMFENSDEEKNSVVRSDEVGNIEKNKEENVTVKKKKRRRRKKKKKPSSQTSNGEKTEEINKKDNHTNNNVELNIGENEIKDGGDIQGDSENDEEELPDWLKIDEDEVVETQGDKGSEDKNEDGVENFLENIEKEEEKENIGDGFKGLMPNDMFENSDEEKNSVVRSDEVGNIEKNKGENVTVKKKKRRRRKKKKKPSSQILNGEKTEEINKKDNHMQKDRKNDLNVSFEEEDTSILAKNAKIPRKEDFTEVPEWLQ